jgi:hypothetical protein
VGHLTTHSSCASLCVSCIRVLLLSMPSYYQAARSAQSEAPLPALGTALQCIALLNSDATVCVVFCSLLLSAH